MTSINPNIFPSTSGSCIFDDPKMIIIMIMNGINPSPKGSIRTPIDEKTRRLLKSLANSTDADSNILKTLVEHVRNIEDPRSSIQQRHLLTDIIVIAIIAVICGCDEWTLIEEFGKSNEQWFRKFLILPHGIPSHDTFGRVFSLLSPKAFQTCFSNWITTVKKAHEKTDNQEIIAIDGKTVRGSRDRKNGIGPLHMVSAWAANNRVILGQQATETKSNEITAIPKLLQNLTIQGCIVTIDAMGCQIKIAKQIIDQGGDYVLALKGNQSKLAKAVEEAFIDADAGEYEDVISDYYRAPEKFFPLAVN